MEKPPKFPVDVHTVCKGQVFPENELSEITGLKPEHPDFQHMVAAFQDWLRRELARTGTRYAIRYVKRTGCIEVLQDREASHHCNLRIGQKLASAHRYLREFKAVDPSGFSPDERRDHERSVMIRSEQILAARHAGRAAVSRTDYERTTPGRLVIHPASQ